MSAKSLLMSCLTKLERSYYAVGTSSTKSGIFDYLFDTGPSFDKGVPGYKMNGIIRVVKQLLSIPFNSTSVSNI